MSNEMFEYYNFSDYCLKFFDGQFHVYDDDRNHLASFELNKEDAELIAKIYGVIKDEK